MADYTLTYFAIRGLGELPRLVLAASGADWKDERLTFSRNADGSFVHPEWDERKKTAPYGQAPILTVNGEQLAQSAAIVRFVAQRHGLAGSNDIESALIDAGFEALQDIRKTFHTIKSDEAKLEQFWSTGLGQSLAFLNKNVRGETFFGASDKLSYTDIYIYYLIFILALEKKEVVDTLLAQNTKLAAIYNAVEKNDKIAAYVAKREDTLM